MQKENTRMASWEMGYLAGTAGVGAVFNKCSKIAFILFN